MTKTYTQTFMIRDLTAKTFVLRVYEGCKYNTEEEGKEVRYNNVKAWTISDGEDAEKIEAETDGSCIDEFHEYLTLHFANGDTATFRNSHVDMWIR